MNSKNVIFLTALALASSISTTLPTSAQTKSEGDEASPENQSVQDRTDYFRPDKPGIHVGSFFIIPSLDVGEKFDSNVYASHDNPKSDFITTVTPSIGLRSDFERHALEGDLSVTRNQYTSHTSESTFDGSGQVRGRIDFDKDTNLAIWFGTSRNHEARGSSDDPSNFKYPIQYWQIEQAISLNKAFGNFTLGLGNRIQRFVYDQGENADGSKSSQGYRDATVDVLTAKGTYAITPGYAIYIQGDYNWQMLGRNLADMEQASHGFKITSGVKFELTRLLTGEFGLGWMRQDYDQPGIKATQGLAYHSALTWQPTTLVSVMASADRSVSPTSWNQSIGRIDDAFSLRAYYEILRDLKLNAGGQFIRSEYVDTIRLDRTWKFGGGLDYALTKNLILGGDYTYTMKQSNTPGNEYYSNFVGIHVKATY